MTAQATEKKPKSRTRRWFGYISRGMLIAIAAPIVIAFHASRALVTKVPAQLYLLVIIVMLAHEILA